MDEREARATTLLLFESLFGFSTADVLIGRDDELSDIQKEHLSACVNRISHGEPVQYVLGQTFFCGLDLKVAPGVLIPRPETEELVRMIASDHEWLQKLRILDIGTGSGCIALALKQLLPNAEVTGWDISTEALAVAQENAKRTGLDVTSEQRDIFHQPMSDTTSEEQFDIIVSNPPYVCHSEAAQMEQNVLDHEPHTALFVPDDDPLLFYRAITSFATAALKPGGRIYFEINRRFPGEVSDLLKTSGFTDIKTYDDQFANPRFVSARYNLAFREKL